METSIRAEQFAEGGRSRENIAQCVFSERIHILYHSGNPSYLLQIHCVPFRCIADFPETAVQLWTPRESGANRRLKKLWGKSLHSHDPTIFETF